MHAWLSAVAMAAPTEVAADATGSDRPTAGAGEPEISAAKRPFTVCAKLTLKVRVVTLRA